MKWVVALLLASLLAGCASSDEPAVTPAPEPSQQPPATEEPPTTTPSNTSMAPIFPIAYEQRDCNAVVLIHAVDFATANGILPLGYTAADMGYLMDLPANLNLAAIGLITYTCQDDDLGVGPHTQAALSVFIDAPVFNGTQSSRDEVFLNVYEVHRFFTNETQAARYAAAGWNVTTGLEAGVTTYIAPPADLDQHQAPQPASATTEGTLDGTQQCIGGVTGATGFRLKHENIRFWQETPGGVSLVEYSLNKHGRGGVSFCQYAEDSLVAQTLGRTTCQPGENVGLTVADFQVTGTIEHFPGVYA